MTVLQVDDESWASSPGFAVELVVEADGYTGFRPSFSQLEDVCLQALHQCVSAAASIPRIGSTSTQGESTCQPSTQSRDLSNTCGCELLMRTCSVHRHTFVSRPPYIQAEVCTLL